MAKFASPSRQAASVMKALQGRVLSSVGTVRNYEQGLTRVAEWVKENRYCNGSLREITPSLAIEYLDYRAEFVGQKTLDMERQSIQAMMHHVTHLLEPKQSLPVIKSEHTQSLQSRAYTSEQVGVLVAKQKPTNALATQIAYRSGLRAHELYTLKPLSERKPDIRPHAETKFSGRDGVIYTVQGKGGLIREVLVPHSLAQLLEAVRLTEAKTVSDRGIYYQQNYSLAAGQRWSNVFSATSNRILGWSRGAHGLRHSYAQERMKELQTMGLNRHDALTTVSQEMGHFRPEITETYLR